MCSYLSSPVVLLVGGGLQIVGVAFLIYGLSQTRKSFDSDWVGIPTWIITRLRLGLGLLVSSVRASWNRLTGKGKSVDIQAKVVGVAGTISGAAQVRTMKTPPWHELEPMEAIKWVHKILYEERDQLLDRIKGLDSIQEEALHKEAQARVKGDDDVRIDVSKLALGGLAQEGWATVMILIGIAVTTAAGACFLT